MVYNQEQIIKDLRENILEVVFDKVDGSQRTMRCTLRSDHLPPHNKSDLEEYDAHHVKNPDVVAVWDINANGWRSFRVDRVKYIQTIEAI